MAIDSALGRLGIKQGVCTSSTRPTNPFEGQVIYESDTNRTLVYDNAAWVVVADNQVFSIDAANSRVGIGTTSPQQELHVYSGAPNADLRLQGDTIQYMDIYHGTNKAGMYASSSIQMEFATGGTAKLNIDSSGRVTTPYQPSFKAILGNSQTYNFTGSQALAFNNVLWNIGSHYNSSTGVFTAPVSGTYMVAAGLMQAASATGHIVIEYELNGVKTPDGQLTPPGGSASVSSAEGAVSVSGTTYLSANDTLQLLIYKSYSGTLGNGTANNWGVGRNFFSVALLG